MFDKAIGRVLGRANQLIHNRAAQQFPDLVTALVDNALVLWAGNNWHTFDHLESNCSVQLYRWLQEAKRTDMRFFPLSVNIENIEFTPRMLAGTESIVGASRPDLRIHVGESGVLLEAKRLTATARHCRAYVDEGMARFVTSAYAAAEDWGVMIGYVQEPTTVGLEPRVNKYVNTHALMGAGHELVAAKSTNAHSKRWQSSHARSAGLPIRLDHVWVVLP